MHIMEGYLPVVHAAGWWAASAPFLVWGVGELRRELRERPESRLVLGACGGFAFVLSALKLPSVTGSCSHPTGIGLGSVVFGPALMIVVGFVVLLFQALLLAHGGLSTLGANLFSMGIVGSLTATAVYRGATGLRLSFSWAVFLAACLSDMATYVTTSLQLGLAFPDAVSGTSGAALKFLGIFSVTQVPLAISEGLLTVLVMNLLRSHAPEQMFRLLPGLREGVRK